MVSRTSLSAFFFLNDLLRCLDRPQNKPRVLSGLDTSLHTLDSGV